MREYEVDDILSCEKPLLKFELLHRSGNVWEAQFHLPDKFGV